MGLDYKKGMSPSRFKYCYCEDVCEFVHLYGITQDPETKDFMLVMTYASDNLHDFIRNVKPSEYTWERISSIIFCISSEYVYFQY